MGRYSNPFAYVFTNCQIHRVYMLIFSASKSKAFQTLSAYIGCVLSSIHGLTRDVIGQTACLTLHAHLHLLKMTGPTTTISVLQFKLLLLGGSL